PCGEGIGGLRPPSLARITPMRSISYGKAPRWGSCGDPLTDPHPSPSPQGGGERTECAASLMHHTNERAPGAWAYTHRSAFLSARRTQCPLRSESGKRLRSVTTIEPTSAAFSVGRFGSRPVERPFHKFDGIDCRPELDAKIVNRLLHRHRQFPPPVDNAAHRFF